MEKLIKIDFTVQEKVFENKETGFAVLKGVNNDVYFMAVGKLAFVDAGEILKLVGRFVKNETYGKQFLVTNFKRELPNTEQAMIKFLSKSNISGLGEKTAEKIVEHFGLDSLDVLEKNPQRLFEIKTIRKNIVDNVKKDIRNFLSLKRLNIFLQDFNISSEFCFKLWHKWGVFALDKIKDNPYLLLLEDFKVTFSLVDRMAKKLDVKDITKKRTVAAIGYVLEHNALENGHCCVPKKGLTQIVSRFLKEDEEKVEIVLDEAVQKNEFVEYEKNDKKFIFLLKYYIAERYIAEKLYNLSLLKEDLNLKEFENILALEEESLKIKFSKSQKEAIKKAVSNGVFILTGGPGTGKTTILNAVISILEQAGFNIVVCAPTGKAAQKLEDVTEKKTTTIHRLLGVNSFKEDEKKFIHSENKLLKADVVIVDEMSMVDSLLFCSLLKAIKQNCRLILSGDFNQLPCILAGNILKNLLDSKMLAYVSLNEIFRQAEKSLIVNNAHNIINGKKLIFNQKGKDCFFIEKNTPKEIVNSIIYLVKELIPKKFSYHIEKEIQIISPCKKGIVGTIELNKRLQDVANPKDLKKEEFVFGFYRFREGDRLLQTKNNYEILWERGSEKGEGIFNGEIGKIIRVDKENKIFVVDFDGKIAQLDFFMAKDLEKAIAITVHKSQGSEFDVVIIPIFYSKESEFYSKNLLYTAITRGRKLVFLVGVKSLLEKMCLQKRVNFRYSFLKDFLFEERESLKLKEK